MAKMLPFEEKIQCPPDNILREVPGRPKSADVRSREHLTQEEVWALKKAAGNIGREVKEPVGVAQIADPGIYA